VRAFGLESATVHRFQRPNEYPDKNRDDSEKSVWKFPKEVYGFYKSAEAHTHKRRIPPRLYLLLLVPVFLAGAGYVFSGWLDSSSENKALKGGAPASEARAAPPAPMAPLSAAAFVESYRPRIEGLPASAPRYDSLTVPKSAPRVALCVSAGSRCRCYTQQGTPIEAAESFCRQVASVGYFNDQQLDSGATVPAPVPVDKASSLENQKAIQTET